MITLWVAFAMSRGCRYSEDRRVNSFRIIRGAIFCHVVRMRTVHQALVLRVGGSHLWKG